MKATLMSCVYVTYLRLINSSFSAYLGFWARMNHFVSQKVEKKGEKRENSDFNVCNLRRFLFGISLDVSKSAFSLVTFNLNGRKWTLVVDIFDQILLTLLTFITLQFLRKVSICCARLLFGMCYYVQFNPRRVIDISHYGEQNLSWNVYL